MKYSLNQIKRYVPGIVAIQPKELVNRIWESVAEVEGVEYIGEKYAGVLVGKILSVEKHPKSEKLLVVQLDIGQKDPVTVVTGAHNIKVDDFVPYFSVGSKVYTKTETIEIADRDMVGIVSHGMIASERELGFGDDHTGILILHQEEIKEPLVPGASLASVLELDDVIIEIENKSLTHRGDCFSTAGIAREIATLFSLPYDIPDWQKSGPEAAVLFAGAFDKDMESSLSVSVTATDSVDRYSAIVLDGIQVQESPLWLKSLLQKLGINPVNNVVDITNYVMLDYGQPMHAFDAAKISHRKRDELVNYTLNVRYAKNGESLVTLDKKERKLSPSTTVIADSQKPIAIAGVIGGLESGITESSTRIILEAATFDKYSIRNASMSLGVVTDASVIFSRKQDPEKTVKAMLRAVHLLQELAGARIASQISDTYLHKPQPKLIVLSHQKIEVFLGVSIPSAKIVDSLERLGMKVTRKNDMYSVGVPSWRPDIQNDEDVYEEIARLFGYQKIPPELPQRSIKAVRLSDQEQIKQRILSLLSGFGFLQSMNFSFVSRALYEQCQLSVDDAYAITNAISPDVQFIRKYVLPGLMAQIAKNQYTKERFGLFELGKTSRKSLVYTSVTEAPQNMSLPRFGIDELGLPIEDEHIALALVDDTAQPGFYSIKSYVEGYLTGLGAHEITYKHVMDVSKKERSLLPAWATELITMLKSGRTAVVYVQHEGESLFVGLIGEPNTFVSRSFGLTKNVGLCELSLSSVMQFASLQYKYNEPSKYPLVVEDLCFEVSEETQYSSVLKIFNEVFAEHHALETTLKPVDIYQKQPGKKQITIRIAVSASDHTITDEEMAAYRAKIVSTVAKKLNGRLI